jgi:hypothetical protein
MAEGVIENGSAEPSPSGGLLTDIVRVFIRPEELFADLPRVNRAAGALWLLLVLHVLLAAVVLSTGVTDYEIERQTQHEMTRETNRLPGDENADQLVRSLEAIEKKAVFTRLTTRLGLLIGGPLGVLLGIVTVAGVLYVTVAVRGTAKADFALLAGVAVFAAYVEVPRQLLRLGLIAHLYTTRVETSAAAFVSAPHTPLGLYLLLRRLDPFDLWYWLLIGLGVCKAGQLPAGRAAVVTILLAALTALLLLANDFQTLADVNEFWKWVQEEGAKQ